MSQQLRESSANLTRNGEIGNVSTVEGKFRESYYKLGNVSTAEGKFRD